MVFANGMDGWRQYLEFKTLSAVTRVMWTHDQDILTGTQNGSVAVWDAETGLLLQCIAIMIL